MKTLQISIITLLFLSLFGCEKTEKGIDLVKFINSELNNKSSLTSLTNDYEFRRYENGIGRDLSKPINNDSIIILKNNLTQNIDISKINKGKVLLIDSIVLCNLSHKYDQSKKIMRSFLNVTRFDTNGQYKLELKNWVPQYINDGFKCIEFEN